MKRDWDLIRKQLTDIEDDRDVFAVERETHSCLPFKNFRNSKFNYDYEQLYLSNESHSAH